MIIDFVPEAMRGRVVDALRSFLGVKCADTLLQAPLAALPKETACLRVVTSRVLSAGILAGGMIVKLPQIGKVVAAQSAAGLSLVALLLETLSYAIVTAYNVRQGHPFMTYGETLFILIQNALLVGLLLFLNAANSATADTQSPPPKKGSSSNLKASAAPAAAGQSQPSLKQAYVLFLAWIVFFSGALYGLLARTPSDILALLQSGTIGLALAARVPQILSNALAGSTGQLSALSTLLIFAGSTARVFTTWQEVKDPSLLLTCAVAAGLNAVLMLQVLYYWNAAGTGQGTAAQKKIKTN